MRMFPSQYVTREASLNSIGTVHQPYPKRYLSIIKFTYTVDNCIGLTHMATGTMDTKLPEDYSLLSQREHANKFTSRESGSDQVLYSLPK